MGWKTIYEKSDKWKFGETDDPSKEPEITVLPEDEKKDCTAAKPKKIEEEKKTDPAKEATIVTVKKVDEEKKDPPAEIPPKKLEETKKPEVPA